MSETYWQCPHCLCVEMTTGPTPEECGWCQRTMVTMEPVEVHPLGTGAELARLRDERRERPMSEHPDAENIAVRIHYQLGSSDLYARGWWGREGVWDTCDESLSLTDAVGWLSISTPPKETAP